MTVRRILVSAGLWGGLRGVSGDMGILCATVAARAGRFCATILRQFIAECRPLVSSPARLMS